MCKIKLEEEIPQNVFDNNTIVITLTYSKDTNVKTSIGNLKYYYDNSKGKYGYIIHLYVVSKIVNTNCIYNIDNASIKQQANFNNIAKKYNEQVNNIDKNTFENNPTEYSYNDSNLTNDNQTKIGMITKEEADEIAEKGFKEAERIVGQYSKDTQDVKIQEVYANNFFTRKDNETDRVYNNQPMVKCYVYTRTDDMLNGVSIYIDMNTGKIIGGRAFGD